MRRISRLLALGLLVATGTSHARAMPLSSAHSMGIPAGSAGVSLARGWERTRVAAPSHVRVGAPLTVVAAGPGLVAGTTFDDGGPSMSLAIWTSVNGRTWKSSRLDPATFPANASFTHIVSGKSEVVATGLIDTGEGGNGAMWTSADGARWRRVPDPHHVLNRALMDAIVAAGPGYVAAARGLCPATAEYPGGSELWTSSDGMSWRRVPNDCTIFANAQVSSIVKTGHGLLGVGTYATGPSLDQGYGAAWTSPDGTTWKRLPGGSALFGTGTAISSVTVTPAGLIARGISISVSGELRSVLWVSSNGLAWKVLPSTESGIDGTVASGTRSLAFGTVGGDVALWSLSGESTWRREAQAAAFGVGNCHVSTMVPFKDGLAAIGTCATPPDLSPFVAAWVWTPRGSRSGARRSGGRNDPRAFTLTAADLPSGTPAHGRYIHLWDAGVDRALGRYAAYDLSFGTLESRTIQSLTIATATNAVAVHGMALIGRLFTYPVYDDQCAVSRKQRPTLLLSPLRFGQQTKVFATQEADCNTTESDTFGETVYYPSRVVVWRDGRYIGAVQVTGNPESNGSELLKAAQTYARRVWMHERATFGSRR